MFYKRVWSVNKDNGRGIDISFKDNKVCRDKVLLWEKIKGMSYSYEYISNVTGLSMGMINEFCFGANKGFDSSVENHLRIVWVVLFFSWLYEIMSDNKDNKNNKMSDLLLNYGVYDNLQ